MAISKLDRKSVLVLLQQLEERVLLLIFLLRAGVNPLAPEFLLNRRRQCVPVLLPNLCPFDPAGPGARLLGRGKALRLLARARPPRVLLTLLPVDGPGLRPRLPALLTVCHSALLDLVGVDPRSAATDVVLLVVLPRHPEGG